MMKGASLQKLRSPVTLVIALVLLLVGLGALWFFTHFKRVEYEYRRDISPIARKNPLLGAARYLQAQGKQCSMERGLALFANLPPTSDVIFIRRMPASVSATMHKELLDWIGAGGHLVVAPGVMQGSHPNTVNFLKTLGIKQVETDKSDCGCEVDEDVDPIMELDDDETDTKLDTAEATSAAAPVDLGTETVTPIDCSEGYHPHARLFTVDIDNRPITLQYFESTLLINSEKASSWRIGGNVRTVYKEDADKTCKDHRQEEFLTGDWLLQYRIGAGTVTVLADMFLFANNDIGEYDHAFFLSWLVGDSPHAWLLQSAESEPLAQLLWRKAPWLIISLGVVLGLWLWYLQGSLGPRREVTNNSQRNILTHIEASGNFAWRIDKCRAMLSHNRSAMLGLLSRRKFGDGCNGAGEQLDLSLLSARTGLDENLITTAFAKPVTSELEFAVVTRAMQKVQKTIHSGDRT